MLVFSARRYLPNSIFCLIYLMQIWLERLGAVRWVVSQQVEGQNFTESGVSPEEGRKVDVSFGFLFLLYTFIDNKKFDSMKKCFHQAQLYKKKFFTQLDLIWLLSYIFLSAKYILTIILLSIRNTYCVIGLAVRVFANGLGDLGSIPGRVIPKTQKMVLDACLLNTQHYKVRIKCKVEQSREGVTPSPTTWCSRYRKGSLRLTLDYGRQLTYIL